MSKIVVEELDVCCKFFEKVRLTPSPKQRMYVDISHNVSCSNFVIFISYDHKDFHVKTFISDILEEAIKSELFRFGWKVHWPLIEEKKCTLSFVWTPSWHDLLLPFVWWFCQALKDKTILNQEKKDGDKKYYKGLLQIKRYKCFKRAWFFKLLILLT